MPIYFDDKSNDNVLVGCVMENTDSRKAYYTAEEVTWSRSYSVGVRQSDDDELYAYVEPEMIVCGIDRVRAIAVQKNGNIMWVVKVSDKYG